MYSPKIPSGPSPAVSVGSVALWTLLLRAGSRVQQRPLPAPAVSLPWSQQGRDDHSRWAIQGKFKNKKVIDKGKNQSIQQLEETSNAQGIVIGMAAPSWVYGARRGRRC